MKLILMKVVVNKQSHIRDTWFRYSLPHVTSRLCNISGIVRRKTSLCHFTTISFANFSTSTVIIIFSCFFESMPIIKNVGHVPVPNFHSLAVVNLNISCRRVCVTFINVPSVCNDDVVVKCAKVGSAKTRG